MDGIYKYWLNTKCYRLLSHWEEIWKIYVIVFENFTLEDAVLLYIKIGKRETYDYITYFIILNTFYFAFCHVDATVL